MTRIRSFILSAVVLFSLATSAFAQEKVKPDSSLWNPEVVAKLAGSQVGFQNWAEGGVNSFAFSFGIAGKAEREKAGWHQKTTGKLCF